MSVAVFQVRVILKRPNSLIPLKSLYYVRRSSLPALNHLRWLQTSGSGSNTYKSESSKNQSGWLSEKTRNQVDAILTQSKSIPNLITLARIASTPILCYFIVEGQFTYAMYGCALAGLSDWLDGFIARTYNMKTNLGTYLDPLGDKIIINSMAISLCYMQLIPWWCTGLWLGRDVALIGMSYRAAAIAARGRDHAVADPSRTPLKVKPTQISKLNTVFQFGTIGATIATAAFVEIDALTLYNIGPIHFNALGAMCYVTSGTTILSALSYLDGKSMIRRNGTDR